MEATLPPCGGRADLSLRRHYPDQVQRSAATQPPSQPGPSELPFNPKGTPRPEAARARGRTPRRPPRKSVPAGRRVLVVPPVAPHEHHGERDHQSDDPDDHEDQPDGRELDSRDGDRDRVTQDRAERDEKDGRPETHARTIVVPATPESEALEPPPSGPTE